MSGANLIGPMVTGGMFERAIVDHLIAEDPVTHGTWLATAIGEVERIEGLDPGALPKPLAVVTSSDFEKMPEDQLPCILVITPGLTRPPERKGDGSMSLTWGLGIAAIVTDTDGASTRLLGQAYAAAISLAVALRPSFGLGARTVFADERYDDLDFGDGRTLGAGRCVFEVTVPNARSLRGGPSRPLPDPGVDPGPWPDVTEVSIDTDLIPITEDVTS